MIQSPPLLVLALCGIVALLSLAEKHPAGKRLFNLLPVPFWCYMIPMVGSAAGILPASSPLYLFLSRQLMPICLLLLLIPADIRGIARLGTMALILAGIASFGTMAGALLSYWLHKPYLPEGSWAAVGAMTATWIGGSSNLVAAKEALGASDSLMGPVIVMDALITYSWMALLIWGSAVQTKWDGWVGCSDPQRGLLPRDVERSERAWIPEGERASSPSEVRLAGTDNRPEEAIPGRGAGTLFLVVVLAILISLGAQKLANFLPSSEQMINPFTWAVILVTSAGIAISLLPAPALKQPLLSKTGNLVLLLLLTSIGARADLKSIFETPVFLSLGLVWILVHGAVTLAGGWLLKAPLGLIASSSQALVGGVISGPIVAATYHPRLATAALLIAILGNCTGTYLGILTAALVKNF